MRSSKLGWSAILLITMIGCAGEAGTADRTRESAEQGEKGDKGDQGDKGEPGDPAERALHHATFQGIVQGEGLVDGRVLRFTKEGEETLLRVTYSETLAPVYEDSVCQWTLLFNGQECVQPGSVGVVHSGGLGQVTTTGYCRGTSAGDLGAGPITIKVRATNTSDDFDGYCLTGDDEIAGTLDAEEID